MSKTFLLATLVAFGQARFNQEQVPVAAVAALGNRGNPGEAATLAGGIPSSLLGAANSCDKLILADRIVTALGNTADVIAAAKGLVAAEKNTNEFVNVVPPLCSDPGLPATPELRGIIPLVSPTVLGSNVQNANSAASLANPINAVGQSIATLSTAGGFTNFTAQAPAGGAAGGNGGNQNNNGGNQNNGGGKQNNGGGKQNNGGNGNNAGAKPPVNCGGAGAGGNQNNNGGNQNNNGGNQNNGGNGAGAGAGAGVQKSTIANLDFGLCVPTMKFEGGVGNRPDTEFTFQVTDALARGGQSEALNPNIITNHICNQLTNVCQANQASKDACIAAKASILALGTRNLSTAQEWNRILGFAGANTNPDNTPQPA